MYRGGHKQHTDNPLFQIFSGAPPMPHSQEPALPHEWTLVEEIKAESKLVCCLQQLCTKKLQQSSLASKSVRCSHSEKKTMCHSATWCLLNKISHSLAGWITGRSALTSRKSGCRNSQYNEAQHPVGQRTEAVQNEPGAKNIMGLRIVLAREKSDTLTCPEQMAPS